MNQPISITADVMTSADLPPPPPLSSSSSIKSLKCLRCSCIGIVNFIDHSIQSSCCCLCCHTKDSSCTYCGIDKCIECNEKYILQFDEDNNYYFSCSKHCHHQKSAFSDNFNSLSRHRINRRIPPAYKTLLHSSVLAGDPDLTWDLLLKGANPFICDASGVTPIDLAKLLRTVKIQSTSKERKIFEILPKISYPDSSVEPPTDTRLRTQSDCGPEIPNTFMLSPKKPKMKKQHLRTEHSVIRHMKKQKSPRRKSKPNSLSVKTDISYRPQFEGSLFEPSTSPPYPHPPFTAPNPTKKKRSMTLTSSIHFPPETPRVHIHNNTFSKATSIMLSKKARAMTLTDHNEPATTSQPIFSPLSYGHMRRERAQTITDTSPKKNKIIKDGKIVSASWDTNSDLVSKRPLLRGLVQAGYRLAISNAPDLLKGKQVFTPLTLLKLSSDNSEISTDDYSTPLATPHHPNRHFQPTMSSVAEGDIENDGQLETFESVKSSQPPDEWIQWEISQFRDIIINETDIEIPYNQRKTPSRTPSALTSRTGSYADFSNLENTTISRNSSQNQLANLAKTSKGSVSNKDIVAMANSESSESSRLSPPTSALQAPTPMRTNIIGVASRPNTSSPSIPKARINLSNMTATVGATPPPLAPDASGEDVANAFAAFAQSMNTSTPPILPKHLKASRNMNTPPKSPAIVSETDEKLKSKSPAVISDAEDKSHYDNSDSVDICSMEPQVAADDLLLTCTGCYDELPASQMVYTCSRMGCMSHLCQDCIFRSVFITITSALYAVPRIKCPGRCMHAIPTRIWRGILRGMKISDEDKLTVHVEDQYPILRLLDLLYESFELFCGDYEESGPSDRSKLASGVESKYVHMCDMLKKIETILIQDGYTIQDLYNTVYEIREKESNESDNDSSDESDSDEEDEANVKIIPDATPKVDITSFDQFSKLVYPKKNVPDTDLDKSFLLMEDILNDSEIESNRLGVKKIRKLRLCVFLSHAAVIVRDRLNTTLISSEYVGNYVMNIYHNDAESLLMKKYVHNANALLTIRCGGCDDTVSLYHTVENGKQLIFEKSEREKILNKILSSLQSSSLSPATNSSNILLFLRNWIHFLTHRMPAVTFVANILSSYLNKLSLEGEQGPTKVATLESQLDLGIMPTELFKFLDLIISLILDVERRFAAQLEIYRKYPKIRVPCCDTKHCFLCKIQGHHKNKTCSEIQNTERGLNCQYCPGCGVATLRTEGCTEILCVCGAVWKWKAEEKKVSKENQDGEENKRDENDDEKSSDDDSESGDDDDESSESDSWDDDSSDDSSDF